MKKIAVILLSLVTVFALTACGGSEEEASGSGEKLVVYTAIETDYLQDHIDLFEEMHPEIELEIIRDSSGVVISKLLAEKDNPVADVIWGLSVESLIMFDEEYDMLAEYTPEGAENLVEQFSDTKNDPMKWSGIAAYMTAIAVNTAELEKLGLPIPESYEDLTDPQYEGLITMPNPASSGTGFLTVSGLLQLFGEEEGWDYLDRLHKNIGIYTHSGSKPAVEAATGEFPIGISFDGRAIAQLDSGAPLEIIFPEEGSGWTLEANALIEREDIKDEAKVFLDWANSQEAMESYNKQFALTGIDLGNEPPEGYPEDIMGALIDIDLYWAADNRIEIVDEWVEKYDGKSEPEEG